MKGDEENFEDYLQHLYWNGGRRFIKGFCAIESALKGWVSQMVMMKMHSSARRVAEEMEDHPPLVIVLLRWGAWMGRGRRAKEILERKQRGLREE